MAEPVISCIIPTFNRALLLKDAIESTLNQTFKNWELIIVDDGSTDETEKVVREYTRKDSRIKFFRNDKKGQASARNYGLLRSNGKYIAFLDDDDVSLPHRFESQLKASKNSGNNFIVSGYQVRDRQTGKLMSEHKLELRGAGAGFPSRWLISKELLSQTDGFKEDFPSMEEIELSYRLSELEIFALHDEIVSILYPTENSVSRVRENNLRGMVLMMEQFDTIMIPLEAAVWYFTIGYGYYSMGEKRSALIYFKKAAEISKSFNFRLGYLIAAYFPFLGGIIKRLNLKILQIIGNYGFPALVNHPIVK